jgi:hypothetical protein
MTDRLKEVDLKVIRGIINAVEDRGPNWTYPDEWRRDGIGTACFNLNEDGSASCIIGYIAVNQELPTYRESASGVDASRWGVSMPIRLAMTSAQDAQDIGSPWGIARSDFFRELADAGYTSDVLLNEYGIEVPA